MNKTNPNWGYYTSSSGGGNNTNSYGMEIKLRKQGSTSVVTSVVVRWLNANGMTLFTNETTTQISGTNTPIYVYVPQFKGSVSITSNSGSNGVSTGYGTIPTSGAYQSDGGLVINYNDDSLSHIIIEFK